MSTTLKTRVATLERELASLKEKVENPESPWWKQNLGQFANDPIYAEAMKLGRAFREGQRFGVKPKTVSQEKVKGGTRVRARHRRALAD